MALSYSLTYGLFNRFGGKTEKAVGPKGITPVIIIVGGGIAGLSLGWQLVKRGEKVTLIEAQHVGSGASWAASAYLEPRLGTGAMRALEWASLKAWPQLVRDIEQASGVRVDYRQNGQLRLAFAGNIDKIRQEAEIRQAEGWNVNWLEGQQLSKCQPHLSDAVVAAAFLPDVHWLDGRILCQAMATAMRNSGGLVIEGQKVDRILHVDGKITGVATGQTDIKGAQVVLACAMGTNDIADLPPELPRCRPVKGAILSLGMDPRSPLTSYILRHPNGHILVPRSDGRLLIGSTHEDGETSTTLSNSTQNLLLQSAIDLLPAVADLDLVEACVGIRALVGDGALRLGACKSCEGLYYSLSHAGAGFLRAPVIAEQFADFILDSTSVCRLIDKFLRKS